MATWKPVLPNLILEERLWLIDDLHVTGLGREVSDDRLPSIPN